MIFVDRFRVAEPEILRQRGPRELAAAKRFYAQPLEERRQRRFPFKLYRAPEVRKALEELFHGKCAYCETRYLGTQPTDIEQFRPKGGVVGRDGTHYPDHYWWLANEWSNLYAVCIDCNRTRSQETVGGKIESVGKGNRFPLESGTERAPLLADRKVLAEERRLLLDPCELADEPERHLVFTEEGTVVSESLQGQTTIAVLGLNRLNLVERRHERHLRIRHSLRNLSRALKGLRERPEAAEIRDIVVDGLGELRGFLRPSEPFLALTRQVLGPVLPKHEKAAAELGVGEGAELGEGFALDAGEEVEVSPREAQALRKAREVEPITLEEARAVRKEAQEKIHRAKRAFQQFEEEQASYSLEDESGMDRYRSRSRQLELIRIRNVKALARQRFEIKSSGAGAPWLMLLGDNATGKSTVLQSVALALLGDRYRDRLVEKHSLDLAGFVRDGCDFGEVTVRMRGAEQRTMRITRDGKVEFEGSPGAQTLLVAYGSTRLLPRQEDARTFGTHYARVENLFDPFIPLVDARRWLLDLDDELFDYTARALKGLLDLGGSDRFVREGGQVLVRIAGAPIPLERLCDGYQTGVALFADVLEIVLKHWPTPESAEGIVMIDEVGNHLHPTWKIRFVAGMRDLLPGMQVIATTHEPLCLRGLFDGEVAVLRKGPRGGISQVPELPSIEGLRVDQLLTSDHFGLDSTVDPKLQERIDEYYDLLRRKRRSAAVQKRVDELRSEIDARQRLGKTDRERLLLEVIDEFLARQRAANRPTARGDLSAVTLARLQEIWEGSAKAGSS